MSFNLIHDFQMTLYDLLEADKELRGSIEGIYLSLVQDAKYPFLLINILRITNVSGSFCLACNVEFEISVFARDKSRSKLILLADKVISRLNLAVSQSKDYTIAGAHLRELAFYPSHDLVTTKLSMLYQALLKKEVIG